MKFLLSPKACYCFCRALQPLALMLWIFLVVVGLVASLILAPVDYQQSDVYRILFIHVPSAVMSLFIYAVMALSAAIYLIWKIKIADWVAKICAPLGALFTLLTLVTGSLWGKPTWGTFWIWDARLTSELVLLFVYLSIMALRSAIPAQDIAARASGMITIIGVVNLPIVHYSVEWWQTLHQGATLLKLGIPSISFSMLLPLLAMLFAFLFYFIWILTVRLSKEILVHEKKTVWVKTEVQEHVSTG
jgi:heme exporter protein C